MAAMGPTVVRSSLRRRVVFLIPIFALLALSNLAFFDVFRARSRVVYQINRLTPKPPGWHLDDVPESVAFCLAVRDQALDLPEFLVHHYHHHKIHRFYIVDDGSDPPLETFDYPGLPRSALDFDYISPEERANITGTVQQKLYDRCAYKHGSRHRWIAFFDTDEFLEVLHGNTLQNILTEYEQDPTIGAIGVNWRIHTSGGQLHRAKSVRHTYDTCIADIGWQDNQLVKSIVRMNVFDYAENPHVFNTKPDRMGRTYTVGDDAVRYHDGDKPNAWRPVAPRKRMALHHYAMKSMDEYQDKINRWKGEMPKNMEWWNHIEVDLEHVSCPELMSYEP